MAELFGFDDIRRSGAEHRVGEGSSGANSAAGPAHSRSHTGSSFKRPEEPRGVSVALQVAVAGEAWVDADMEW